MVMSIMLPGYCFLVICGLFIIKLIFICFYYSEVFLLLCSYPCVFIALSSFYYLLAIRLFSLLYGLFCDQDARLTLIANNHAVIGWRSKFAIRFWPALCYIFDLIFRAE